MNEGVCISKEEHLKSKQKVEEKSKEKEIEWGKGLAQKREAEAQLKELEIEKDKLLPATGKLRAIYGGGRCHHLFSTFGADGIPSCGFGFGDAIVVGVAVPDFLEEPCSSQKLKLILGFTKNQTLDLLDLEL
ncbi:hypothetical protein Ahy_A05g022959 isoform A [Arachis hypogaea]|uniref:Uncharacterized protein n=1 Tax=Arachis hypogaea TaxID=3818 RepID=A0A445D1Z4_ARAHY|nr:hypothetical protein Ahy_A05g022959 isoform A [Arachis hypogaea]